MTGKTYCGTKESILEQLHKDLDFKPAETRYSPDVVVYPFNQDGTSGTTFAEQLDMDPAGVYWMSFTKEPDGQIEGTLRFAKVRILKG